ncbi:VanW family protein [Pseudoglutamicibacter cumminsii]|uniref:VanW family protein n=1 Tax=Pseudoglutamicibacter cumminsii TaxID=156979 RepID=A0AAP4C8A6_9MICC|nr:VanW family protein [Pseudoglutamicibacter cumminsii]MDK6275732.1 VanW family protein [Pseudoglutamicibacter cumminsii]
MDSQLGPDETATQEQSSPQPANRRARKKRAEKRKRGGLIATSITGGVLLLAGAAYVGSAWYTSDKLPANLTVSGVDISGLSTDEAAAKLDKELGSKLTKELTLTAGNATTKVTPAKAGIGIDTKATLEELSGWSWNPKTIIERLSGSQEVSIKQTIDDKPLKKKATEVAEALTTDPVEGKVNLTENGPEFTEPENGHKVSEELARTTITKNAFAAKRSVSVDAKVVDPQVSTDKWNEFIDTTVEPYLSGPVTVKAGDETAELSVKDLSKATVVEVKDSTPQLKTDDDALKSAVEGSNSKLHSTAQNASLKLVGSGANAKAEIVPSKTGKGLDAKELGEKVRAAAESTSGRTATVTLSTQEPTVTTADAKKWKVTKVAEFATPYPYDPTRTKNLVAGSKRINGSVIEPGESFDLAQKFGPVTEANGYYSSGVVVNSVSTKAVGGGLSQIATMAYNAGYLAGMDIEAWRPHNRWFDRYPAGRESTYWEGSINVKWKNNTKAPVVVAMWLADNKVHTAVYGHKTWDVKTSTSDFYNYTTGPTITSNDPHCIPESGGKRGFTVDVSRTRTNVETGEVLKDSQTTRYDGWPKVTCKD